LKETKLSMNSKKLLAAALACAVVLAAALALQGCNAQHERAERRVAQPPAPEAAQQAAPAAPAPDAHAGHAHGAQERVPAYVSAAEAKRLSPTLAPAQFTGKTRAAYQAVKEIPQTIAQLPCYCYCDTNFGHKSLHSCFEDEHAAQCAVCVEEALTAYRLQKEEKLTPAEIRARIIAEYGPAQ
jgi:uncharacterized protein with PCYCGC motif